jgi:tRNA A37 threonylcarbamoyladenosine biosynthesis protein TsaE
VVEWPERLGPALPHERFDIQLQITGDDTRTISIRAHGPDHLVRLEGWWRKWPAITGCDRGVKTF